MVFLIFSKIFQFLKNFNFLCIKVENVKNINPPKLEKAGPSLPPDVNNFIQTINISGSDDPVEDEKLSEEAIESSRESEINASGEKDSEKNAEIIESNNLGSEQQQDERNSEIPKVPEAVNAVEAVVGRQEDAKSSSEESNNLLKEGTSITEKSDRDQPEVKEQIQLEDDNKFPEEPYKINTEPYDAGEEPTRTTEEPIKTAEESNIAAEELSNAYLEPNKSVEKPIKTAEESSNASLEPNKAVEEPTRTTEEPIKTAEESNIAAEASSNASLEPNKAVEEPNKTAEEPNTTPEEPYNAPEEPNNAGEEPNKIAEEPNTTLEEPNNASVEPIKIAEEQNNSTEERRSDEAIINKGHLELAEDKETTEEPKKSAEKSNEDIEKPIVATEASVEPNTSTDTSTTILQDPVVLADQKETSFEEGATALKQLEAEEIKEFKTNQSVEPEITANIVTASEKEKLEKEQGKKEVHTEDDDGSFVVQLPSIIETQGTCLLKFKKDF